MRPSGPGIWGVCGPPADSGDSHQHQKVPLHFCAVQCTLCGMLGRVGESWGFAHVWFLGSWVTIVYGKL